MPCLEIKMPRTDKKTKDQLAAKLTKAFTETTGHDPSIFGILFQEYEFGAVAYSGSMSSENKGRPFLHFVLYCPRLKKSVKSKLVRVLTEAFVECVGNDEWKPVIHINEHPYDNVGVQGQLLSEQFDELGKAKFYYELPED